MMKKLKMDTSVRSVRAKMRMAPSENLPNPINKSEKRLWAAIPRWPPIILTCSVTLNRAFRLMLRRFILPSLVTTLR